MLEVERAFYEQMLPEWLKVYAGKVALVRGETLVGVFDDEADALNEGARQFGSESFLIRRIQEQQSEVSIPALTLGILRATHPTSITSAGARPK